MATETTNFPDISLDQIIKMKKKDASQKRGNKPNSQRLKNLATRSGLIRKGGPKPQQTIVPRKNEPTRLHVSNLHFKVTSEDVRELFADIGLVKKAAVHYDKSGRSLGTAEVIFASRQHATAAIKKYHSIPLDGRPMYITLVPSQTTVHSPAKSRIGVKQNSGVFKKSQQTKNPKKGQSPKNKGKFQRGQRNQQKKEVTAEQLDAELEAYSKPMEH